MLCWSLQSCEQHAPAENQQGSPLDSLPAWITPLLDTGLRPDWSADGTHIVYLDALVGNVYEVELATDRRTNLTQNFDHLGFTRARYLANGDLLLCGPTEASVDGDDGGRWSTELWFLARGKHAIAQRLNEPCFEGPAVSRNTMSIAWTRSDYPDELVFARSQIWSGRIEVDNGKASIVERRKLVERKDFLYLAFLETQDFRPPDDKELLFTAYAYKGGEVMGVSLDSGKLTNYSDSWGYDEAEGVFPDGKSIAVEREPDTYTAVPVGDIDIWQLALDGSGSAKRLTYFSQYNGFGANNPVVSPDGRKMAFGLRIKGGQHGNADGILLYNFEKASKSSRTSINKAAGD
jgi:hypothetical protein